jgi:hypothetical protein
MKPIFSFILIVLSLSYSVVFAETNYLTSKELRTKYPSIDDGSTRPENRKILCPFWRLIERSGSLDLLNKSGNTDIIISIANIAKKAREFGCKYIECATVASAVSAGQKTYPHTTKAFSVNLSKLHKARGIAHDCGLTFEKGGTAVSIKRRAQTLTRLKTKSVPQQDTLTLDDLMAVKKQICTEENVNITAAGSLEVKLIFSFLGGNDRGFIEYSDVERFLHAKMPLTKAIDKI